MGSLLPAVGVRALTTPVSMRFTTNERHTLELAAVGHFGAHVAMLVFPTIAVILAREEGLPLETVLAWSFAGYFIFGFGALPVGFLTDHIRALWVVRAGALGVGAAMMMVPMAEPGPMLAVMLAAVGLFASFYHPAGLSLISRTVAARGRALGINGVAGNLGVACAPLAAELAATWWGWRGAYLAVGLVLLLMGVAASFLHIDEPVPNDDEGHGATHEPRERLVLFSILLVAMMLGGLTYRANTVAQPAYFAERVAFMGHGLATSLVYLLGTVGQYVGGVLADRYDLRRLYITFHALSLPFVLAMAALSGAPLMLAAAAFIFFSLGMQPIENSLVARFTPERWRSTGYGLKFAVVFGIGSLAVRGIEGFITYFSLAHVFLAVAVVVALIVSTAGYLAWRTRGRPIYNTEAPA